MIYGEKKKQSQPSREWMKHSLLFSSSRRHNCKVHYSFFKLTSTFLFILFLHLGILLQMFLIGLQGYFWESEPRIKKRDVTYL